MGELIKLTLIAVANILVAFLLITTLMIATTRKNDFPKCRLQNEAPKKPSEIVKMASDDNLLLVRLNGYVKFYYLDNISYFRLNINSITWSNDLPPTPSPPSPPTPPTLSHLYNDIMMTHHRYQTSKQTLSNSNTDAKSFTISGDCFSLKFYPIYSSDSPRNLNSNSTDDLYNKNNDNSITSSHDSQLKKKKKLLLSVGSSGSDDLSQSCGVNVKYYQADLAFHDGYTNIKCSLASSNNTTCTFASKIGHHYKCDNTDTYTCGITPLISTQVTIETFEFEINRDVFGDRDVFQTPADQCYSPL